MELSRRMKAENRGANRLMPLDLVEGVAMLHSSREDRDSGAHFEIRIPDQPVSISDWKSRKAGHGAA